MYGIIKTMDSISKGIVPKRTARLREVTPIKIGFKGMGKCGMSLAHHFGGEGIAIAGFSSRHAKANDEFKILTDRELTKTSDVIFITTADDDIRGAWNELRAFDLSEKFIFHCSGSLTSAIFEGADPERVCSVHPMLAFSSGRTSLNGAYFTVEGGKSAASVIKSILKNNTVIEIDARNKPLYHAAACFASNFVVAVCDMAERLLTDCGFSREDAHAALSPLMLKNTENIVRDGTRAAITGPAVRGDTKTLNAHKSALSAYPDAARVYADLTKAITDTLVGDTKNKV